jgi:hypothetical protein
MQAGITSSQLIPPPERDQRRSGLRWRQDKQYFSAAGSEAPQSTTGDMLQFHGNSVFVDTTLAARFPLEGRVTPPLHHHLILPYGKTKLPPIPKE